MSSRTGNGLGLPLTVGRHRPRKRRDDFARAACVTVAVTLVYLALAPDGQAGNERSDNVFHKNRKLLQVEESSSKNSSTDDEPLFPPEAFTYEQLRHGAVAFHIFGILYMFYASALVCDEFFIPALDVITEKLQISPDVAGATFMAAGGSAPELFSSLIGIFFAKNDVGIGTIVGSAVFNILFVIAACAFAAKEALSLTAWPLIRDVFFYSISLILLVVFFLDDEIQWWEALILFLWYIAYVSFMKFNDMAEDGLRKLFRLPERDRDASVRGVTIRNAHNRKGLFHLMNETINPGILRKPRGVEEEMYPLEAGKALLRSNENQRQDGFEKIMIGEPSSGISQLKTQLKPAGSAATDVSTAGNGSTATKEMDEVAGQDAPQHNNIWASAASVNPTSEENGTMAQQVAGEEDEEPIDMRFPKNGGWKQILVYIFSFPIMAPLYITLPDTRNPQRKKYYVITFIGSIVWVAIFSYFMLWWATVAGYIIGIPPAVMGLTFLAAGTSVPDLVTSVLVAKRGKGDMAVSSSVGSNIFDVTVGLPLPWLIYTLAFMQPVTVRSQGVACSVSILFVMLILVFLAIMVFKWKMTKGMGALMMFLYFIFVIVSLGFSYEWYQCPL